MKPARSPAERSKPGLRALTSGFLAGALAIGALAACGDTGDAPDARAPTGDATPTTPAAPATPGPPTADVELIEIRITGGEVNPPLGRVSVDRGTTVRIVVTSDQPDEIHMHGYDLTVQIGPGREGALEFVADRTGLYELETHEQQLVLLQLAVQ